MRRLVAEQFVTAAASAGYPAFVFSWSKKHFFRLKLPELRFTWSPFLIITI
jgi:hypothetical protein